MTNNKAMSGSEARSKWHKEIILQIYSCVPTVEEDVGGKYKRIPLILLLPYIALNLLSNTYLIVTFRINVSKQNFFLVLIYLFDFRHQALSMVSFTWAMSDVYEWGVILQQSMAECS